MRIAVAWPQWRQWWAFLIVPLLFSACGELTFLQFSYPPLSEVTSNGSEAVSVCVEPLDAAPVRFHVLWSVCFSSLVALVTDLTCTCLQDCLTYFYGIFCIRISLRVVWALCALFKLLCLPWLSSEMPDILVRHFNFSAFPLVCG